MDWSSLPVPASSAARRVSTSQRYSTFKISFGGTCERQNVPFRDFTGSDQRNTGYPLKNARRCRSRIPTRSALYDSAKFSGDAKSTLSMLRGDLMTKNDHFCADCARWRCLCWSHPDVMTVKKKVKTAWDNRRTNNLSHHSAIDDDATSVI